jgi:paraquat-inducible protein B
MSSEAIRTARVRHSWWPGWIWSIPVAALLVLGWFLIRALTQGGPDITVIFPAIADIRADDTKVTFEGLKVGQASSVTLEPDLRHLRVKLDLDAEMVSRCA